MRRSLALIDAVEFHQNSACIPPFAGSFERHGDRPSSETRVVWPSDPL
jgi:hypothetical protein